MLQSPWTWKTFLSAVFFSAWIADGSTSASVPPGASRSYATFCVAGAATVS